MRQTDKLESFMESLMYIRTWACEGYEVKGKFTHLQPYMDMLRYTIEDIQSMESEGIGEFLERRLSVFGQVDWDTTAYKELCKMSNPYEKTIATFLYIVHYSKLDDIYDIATTAIIGAFCVARATSDTISVHAPGNNYYTGIKLVQLIKECRDVYSTLPYSEVYNHKSDYTLTIYALTKIIHIYNGKVEWFLEYVESMKDLYEMMCRVSKHTITPLQAVAIYGWSCEKVGSVVIDIDEQYLDEFAKAFPFLGYDKSKIKSRELYAINDIENVKIRALTLYVYLIQHNVFGSKTAGAALALVETLLATYREKCMALTVTKVSDFMNVVEQIKHTETVEDYTIIFNSLFKVLNRKGPGASDFTTDYSLNEDFVNSLREYWVKTKSDDDRYDTLRDAFPGLF